MLSSDFAVLTVNKSEGRGNLASRLGSSDKSKGEDECMEGLRI